jgi:hypothetical protein
MAQPSFLGIPLEIREEINEKFVSHADAVVSPPAPGPALAIESSESTSTSHSDTNTPPLGVAPARPHWDAKCMYPLLCLRSMEVLMHRGHSDKPVSTDEKSTVAGLPAPYRDDEEAVSLLNTEVPTRRGVRQKSISIVAALFALYGLFKFIMWTVTVRLPRPSPDSVPFIQPAPTGLEGMPKFGSLPPCQDAKFLWNGKEENVFNIAVNANQPWHSSKVLW